MSYEKMIPFRCSAKLYDRLAQVAKAQAVTVSELLRLAAEDYVSQTPQQNNLIPFAGTIGGGLEDLAIWEAFKERFKQDMAEFQREVEEMAA